MAVTIFHNPRCSKSRQALDLLRKRGEEPRVVEYLQTLPTVAELRSLLAQLGLPPRELMRRQEPVYAELGLGNPSLDDTALIEAMASYPILIERPIVIAGDRAIIGRPPERILELLGNG